MTGLSAWLFAARQRQNRPRALRWRRRGAGLLAATVVLTGCASPTSGTAQIDAAGFLSREQRLLADQTHAAELLAKRQMAAKQLTDSANALSGQVTEANSLANEMVAKAKAKAAKEAAAKAAKDKAAKEKAAREKAARDKAAREKAAKEKAAQDAARFDPLTGGPRSNNTVVAVKIDNTIAGRPQAGINQADVVYVEQVEGGLTRLLGVFHTQLPTAVGPVRSIRTTDVELLQSYGTPLIAFSGGAGGPLAALNASPVINASGYPGYGRTSAKPAPYNLQVNLPELVAAAPNVPTVKSPGFTFASTSAAAAAAPSQPRVRVQMNAGDTGFTYDASKDLYRVDNGGVPAVDAAGQAVVTKNVLVQHVTDVPDGTVDTNGQPSLLSHTVGKGDFELYRDGKVLRGRWFRLSINEPTKFWDSNDKPIAFDRGRTWVMLAPQDAVVSAG